MMAVRDICMLDLLTVLGSVYAKTLLST